jgi:hypothetical protein
MKVKELYRQKMQAQLDEWKADNARLKAKASGAKADVQLAMNRQAASIERKLEYAQAKLSELAEASEEVWESVKNGVESAWDSLNFAFHASSSRDTKN